MPLDLQSTTANVAPTVCCMFQNGHLSSTVKSCLANTTGWDGLFNGGRCAVSVR